MRGYQLKLSIFNQYIHQSRNFVMLFANGFITTNNNDAAVSKTETHQQHVLRSKK